MPPFPRPEDAVRPSTWAGPGTSIPAPGHPPAPVPVALGMGRAWAETTGFGRIPRPSRRLFCLLHPLRAGEELTSPSPP